MKVPKYVIEMLERSKFYLGKQYSSIPGYTISIEKRTPYAYASTLKDEASRLVEWANREYKKMSGDSDRIAYINYVPENTYFKYKQSAIVTIYDPVMRCIEQYISKGA